MRKILSVFVLIMVFIVLAFTGKVFAGFVHGPVIGPHNFPGTYTGANGLSLQPCLDTSGACGLAAEVSTSFPNPVTYWEAQARMFTYGGKGGNPSPSLSGRRATATLTMILAGNFIPDGDGNPIIAEGNQFVMQSLQIRIDSLLDGASYTVTTPFGVFGTTAAPLTANFDPRRNVDSIKETFVSPALPEAGDFNQSAFPTTAYSSTPGAFSAFPGMDRFLTCEGGPQATGFLGPQVGGALINCNISGSPLGPDFNVFRIEGPEVGGGPTLHRQLLNALNPDPDNPLPDFTCEGGAAIDLARSNCVKWLDSDPPVDMIETSQFRIIGQVSSVPIPASIWLFSSGFGLLGFWKWRRDWV